MLDSASLFDLLGLALARPFERLRAVTALPMLLKYCRITLDEFAQRFSNPFLRPRFPDTHIRWPHTPMVLLLSILNRLQAGDYGWPIGGSRALARTVERRFLELEGNLLSVPGAIDTCRQGPRCRLYVEPFGFNPSLAPPGESVLKVVMATGFDYWEKLDSASERYREEKQDISEPVIGPLEDRYPGLRQQIEAIDVATR